MKIRTLILPSMLLLGMTTASADVNINLPTGCKAKSVQYYYAPINKYAAAKSRSERGLVQDSVPVQNGKAVISLPDNTDNYLWGVLFEDNNISFYTQPNDNLTIDIKGCHPFTYSLSGTPMAEGMNELLVLEAPLNAKAEEYSRGGKMTEEQAEELQAQYMAIQKEFISANPESPAAPVALMNLDGEDFVDFYTNMPASLNNSILYPLVEQRYASTMRSVEAARKQKALSSGDAEAPNFTLKDLEGKDVSLSDFRGKWVILDFWGSWCPWCIKGFPELKEAYQKYAGKLEIIGIDCNESEEDWRAGVKKYDLPWVHVYNPAGSPVTSEYGVTGYPTKAIIDPQGIIKNITVGHDPAFFVALTELMGE